MNPQKLEDSISILRDLVNQHGSVAEAAKRLRRIWSPQVTDWDALDADVQAVVKAYEERAGIIRTLSDAAAITDPNLDSGAWYIGPDYDTDRCWPALRRYLEQTKGWGEKAISSLDAESTKILSLCAQPRQPEFRHKGLVVGYVQSGKTANFTALIAKAADVGYKLIIVLSGITNALRSQTQVRLESELSALNKDLWQTMTTPEADFPRNFSSFNISNFLSAGNKNTRVLCVVKKNATVLRRLYRWLSMDTAILKTCPVLIIDDEADQASVNASVNAEQKRTTINQRLLDILNLLPKVNYVGYTATPFANIFIDPSIPVDLYPSNFIVSLPKPDGYFGPERIFGRDRVWNSDANGSELREDMIRIVPDDQAVHLTPGRADKNTFEPELMPSLRESLTYFWMAVAARWVRGQGDQHASMLVHTSMFTIVHTKLHALIEGFRRNLLARLQRADQPLFTDLRQQWENEISRIESSEFDASPVSFDQLYEHLHAVVTETHVVMDNSISERRLNYQDGPRIQIAIGGDTLARGLTLEGLTTSFFVRGASAYDTLLQMGRWFGYRAGYADLTRMWLTRELAYYFHDLATVEAEMRADIQRYSADGVTPMNFAVRIRAHPDLEITARAKMKAVQDQYLSYSGKRSQTVLFERRNQDWLRGNLKAAIDFVGEVRLNSSGLTTRGKAQVFRNVPAIVVARFLKQYRTAAGSGTVDSYLWQQYIADKNRVGELTTFTVAVAGGDSKAQFDLGGGISVSKVIRTRRDESRLEAHIGALMSRHDSNLDGAVAVDPKTGENDIIAARDPVDGGLLILYPIDKDSAPGKATALHVALDAVEDIMGVAMVFPPTLDDSSGQRYVSVILPTDEPVEVPEWDMDSEEGPE